MKILRGENKDLEKLAQLAKTMWPDSSMEELYLGFKDIIEGEDGVIFIASDEGEMVGFAQCQLRFDYVEGTNSSPVAYLERIFLEEDYRKKGYARELLDYCEGWAREKGCLELASDCELTNEDSLPFHLSLGFVEANRIICFKKKL